jgi:hypothetical protein
MGGNQCQVSAYPASGFCPRLTIGKAHVMRGGRQAATGRTSSSLTRTHVDGLTGKGWESSFFGVHFIYR